MRAAGILRPRTWPTTHPAFVGIRTEAAERVNFTPNTLSPSWQRDGRVVYCGANGGLVSDDAR
jgi:hypothetical protein